MTVTKATQGVLNTIIETLSSAGSYAENFGISLKETAAPVFDKFSELKYSSQVSICLAGIFTAKAFIDLLSPTRQRLSTISSFVAATVFGTLAYNHKSNATENDTNFLTTLFLSATSVSAILIAVKARRFKAVANPTYATKTDLKALTVRVSLLEQRTADSLAISDSNQELAELSGNSNRVTRVLDESKGVKLPPPSTPTSTGKAGTAAAAGASPKAPASGSKKNS